MKWCVALLLLLAACTPSETERARHRQARDSLLTTEVVKELLTPTSTGRLIYDPPVNLSHDSLRTPRQLRP